MAENNALYDLVTTLENKMKAVSAYEMYMKDFEGTALSSARQLFEQIKRDDERHLDQLKEEVAKALQSA
jgi:hypothetical protein